MVQLVLLIEPVSFLKHLSELTVYLEFIVHLHGNELLQYRSLIPESLDLSFIGVLEMVCAQIESWTPGHQVDDDLYGALLLEQVTSMLQTVQIAKA